MTDRSMEKLAEILRNDLYAFGHRSFLALNPGTRFAPHPFLEVLAFFLEKVRLGKTRRLIINMPPRSLKSHFASIVFPAWILGHDPSAQIITASYGQELSDRNARECRTLILAPFYQALFTTRLSPQKQATAEFETVQKGYRLSTSVGGYLVGRGGDYLIIDDPSKPEEALSPARRRTISEWYDGSLYPRQNNKSTARIVMIMQRQHEDDLVGHVLQQEDWEVLSFPAIAERDEEILVETPYGAYRFTRKSGEALHPARESLETLAAIRRTVGPYNFAAQYQQAPAPLEGGLLKREWFRTYDQAPDFDQIVQSWDTASVAAEHNSFSVCTTWGVKGKHFYLIDVRRKRLNYPELKRTVRQLAGTFSANVILIETKSSGTPLYQELVDEGMHGTTKFESKLDKLTRLESQTAAIEQGFVHLPREAPWRDDYVHELTTFPNGTYDDQVDSTSQALIWMRDRSRNSFEQWMEFMRRDLERIHGRPMGLDGKPLPLKMVRVRAPTPYKSYYMSGVAGRAGRYNADGEGIIENVHPEDVERLLALGCTLIDEGIPPEGT